MTGEGKSTTGRIMRLCQMVRQMFSVIVHFTFWKNLLDFQNVKHAEHLPANFLQFIDIYTYSVMLFYPKYRYSIYSFCVCGHTCMCVSVHERVCTHMQGWHIRTHFKISFKWYNNMVTTIIVINKITLKTSKFRVYIKIAYLRATPLDSNRGQ